MVLRFLKEKRVMIFVSYKRNKEKLMELSFLKLNNCNSVQTYHFSLFHKFSSLPSLSILFSFSYRNILSGIVWVNN